MSDRLRGVRTRLLLGGPRRRNRCAGRRDDRLQPAAGALNADDADSLLRQRAVAERAQVTVTNGKVELQEGAEGPAGDSHIWVFQGSRPIEQPRSRAENSVAAARLAGGPSDFDDGQADGRAPVCLADHARLLDGSERSSPGSRWSPYEQTEPLGAAGIARVCSDGPAARVVGRRALAPARRGLEPVAEMTTLAGAWSENDLDRRFARGEPYDELSRLAFTLDRLLDRISASLRLTSRFSAELSHELRTPLAKVAAETELALRRPRTPEEYRRALGVIHANTDQIARIIDTLLAAARAEAGPRRIADASGGRPTRSSIPSASWSPSASSSSRSTMQPR